MVPKVLTEVHKTKQMGALRFFILYENGNRSLNQIKIQERKTKLEHENGLLCNHWNIPNKSCSMFSANVFLIYHNVCPHASAQTQWELQRLQWKIFEHPPYSPDLIPSDFHLFPKLKELLGGKQFGNDEEFREVVTSWLRSLAVEQSKIGIGKLVPRYNKCLEK